jgi:hypothetical protein
MQGKSYRASSQRPYFSADGETYTCPTPLRALEKALPLRVLSLEDWRHWQTFGYVVVKQAIARTDAQKLLEFAWSFQGLDPERPESWYAERTFRTDLERELYIYGLVEAYHHQLLWNSRQTPRVWNAFVDIWDCEELWVTLDRLNLNPPNVRNRDRALLPATAQGFDIHLHWDIDTTLPILPQRVQGIIALNDSQADTGGFHCAPELFRQFDLWKTKQPSDRDPVRPAVDQREFPLVQPALEAGDLLIWNGLLPHGVAPNRSTKGVRAVQYLAMMPALETHRRLRASRVDSWRRLATPEWNDTLIGDAHPESSRYPRASLDALGTRLLGLSSWHRRRHDDNPENDRWTGSV